MAKCKEIFCPNVDEIEGFGELSGVCKKAVPRNTCTLKCEGKLKLDGPASITCLENGKWSREMGICKEIMCPRIPSSGKGTLSGVCEIAKPEDHCKIECGDYKFRLKGAQETKCGADGTWENDLGICEEIFCPNIEDTGYVKLEGHCRLAVPGDRCKIKCSGPTNDPQNDNIKNIFRLVGNDRIECNLEGIWTGDLGHCEQIMCPSPEIRKPAETILSGICHIARPGEECSISCKEGDTKLVVVGAQKITCKENGRWSRYPGSCEESCDIGYFKNDYGVCLGTCEMAHCRNYGAGCIPENNEGSYRCECPPSYLPYIEGETCTIAKKIYKLRLDGIKLNISKTELADSHRAPRSLYLPQYYDESEEKKFEIVEKKIRDAFMSNFEKSGMKDVKVSNCSFNPFKNIILASCFVEMFYLNDTAEVRNITGWIDQEDGFVRLEPELDVRKDVVEKMESAIPTQHPCDELTDICDPENECKKGESPLEYSCPCRPGYVARKDIPQTSVLHVSPVCKDINECLSKENNKCTKNEKCVNEIGSYRCECKPGYKYSDSICIGCLDNPCKNQGICQSNHDHSGFVCICLIGYNGEYCEVKSDKISVAEMNNIVIGSVLGGLLLLSIGGSAIFIANLRKKKTRVDPYENPFQTYTIKRPVLIGQMRS